MHNSLQTLIIMTKKKSQTLSLPVRSIQRKCFSYFRTQFYGFCFYTHYCELIISHKLGSLSTRVLKAFGRTNRREKGGKRLITQKSKWIRAKAGMVQGLVVFFFYVFLEKAWASSIVVRMSSAIRPTNEWICGIWSELMA